MDHDNAVECKDIFYKHLGEWSSEERWGIEEKARVFQENDEHLYDILVFILALKLKIY